MPLTRIQLPHKKHLPSFSLALTQSAPMGETVEVLALNELGDPSKREVHLSFQPKDDDPLMKTVDTRFSGTLGYEFEYPVSTSALRFPFPTDEGPDRLIASR